MKPKTETETRTVDLTPTWVEYTGMIVLAIEAGGKARKAGLDELRRMAEAADKWNAHCKEVNA